MMKNNRELVSVVVPCYNEREALPFFFEEADRVFKELDADVEMIFVDDGSSDGTVDILKSAAKKDTRVRFISFSRNFGKEAAMYAGLSAAKGDYVAIMDADLQDPPRLLPEMLSALRNEGFDSVATKRSTRKGEPPIRSFFARCFYAIMNRISKVRLVPGARDYRLMNRRMCDAVLSLCEYNRFTKGMFEWVGFKTKWLSYENVQRVAGTTKWSFGKLFLYAMECVVSFSTAPLAIATLLGGIVCTGSVVGIVLTAVFGNMLGLWSCGILFLGGAILLSVGVLGMYVARSYLEVKHRPIYIIRETENDTEE